MRAFTPNNETDRLAGLYRYGILDSQSDPSLDRLTRMVASFFAAPICLVSLVDQERQFFKSRYGLSVIETPREQSFCAHAILSPQVTAVPDATKDPRFADNPLVLRSPKFRFYMGAPLIAPDGAALGTVCVIDVEPREYPNDAQLEFLTLAAEQVMEHLETRLEKRQLLDRLNAAEAYRARHKQREHSRELNRDQSRAQHRAEQALEAAHMGYWERDAESDIITFSPVLEEMLGMDHEEYDGSVEGWLRHVHPEDRSLILTTIQEARKTGENYMFKYRPLTNDGRERWITTTGTYKKDAQGRFAGAHGVSWDSTASEIAARRLRMSEELFRALSSSAPIGIFRSDLDCNVTYANPMLASIYRTPDHALQGLEWLKVVHPEDRAPLQESLRAVAEDGSPAEHEHRLLLADGTIRWICVRAIPVRNANGQIIGKVGTVDDVTGQRQMVEELLKAKEEGEVANRAKDLFLANVSHELRTPLNGVLGMSQLLLEDSLTADQLEMADIVRESAFALQSVITDMLDLSRLEKGSFFIGLEPFHLPSTIQQAVSLLKAEARRGGNTLVINYSEALAENFEGDARRIKQILINYLSNAIKFSYGGDVTIDARPVTRNGRAEVLLAVSDTGSGISAEDQKKLFLPFSQVDASMTRRNGGSGLGLVICKRVAELMDGAVGVESEPGKGSTFWVRLPLVRQHAVD